MAYNFSHFQNNIKEVESWLKAEYVNIRTGRASTSFLDQVKVEAYGEMTAITNVATVGAEDAKTLRISPWDSTMIKPIEKAIMIGNLGVSTAVDDKGIRVIFPDLTGERRIQLVKEAKTKLEEAKTKLRKERSEVMDDMNTKKKDGDISEDELTRYKKDVEKYMEDGTNSLDEIFNKKEKEITTL